MSETFKFTKSGTCKNCKDIRTFSLHRQIGANSAENFCWRCESCDTANPERKPQLFIPKATIEQHLTPEQIENLPVTMPALYERCGRCGARGTEIHHWAPRHIFGKDEAEKWPKDYLCKPCHDHWHRVVTPQLTTDR